jgi:zinc-ribbon domain
MASLLERFRRPRPADGPETPAPPRRLPLPSAGRLRRERRNLLRYRERRIHALGALVLEQVRDDAFRADVIYEQAVELVGLEERLRELDGLIAVASARRNRTLVCVQCATPLYPGARFCPSCGLPVAGTAP